MKLKSCLITLLLACTQTVWAVGLDTSSGVIEDIKYTGNNNGDILVLIRFFSPVQLSQAIKDKSNHVDLPIRFNISETQRMLLPLEETRIAEKDKKVPLKKVIFDGFNRNNPLINVTFKYKVNFEAKQIDHKSIGLVLNGIKVSSLPRNLIARRAVRVRKKKRRVSTGNKSIALKMRKGKAALSKGDYRSAISLFTSVYNAKNTDYRADALEMLGVAREKNGQVSMARRIYQDYINNHADNPEGLERVKQRLARIAPKTSAPRLVSRKLSTGPPRVKLKPRKDLFGSLSLYNFKGEQTSDTGSTEINSIRSYLNLRGRIRTTNYELTTVANGTATQRKDLRAANDDKETEMLAERLYVDYKNSFKSYSARLGRQPGNSGGLFGRFDGMLLGYQLFSKMKLNAAYGYPVDYFRKDSIQTNAPVTSISINFGSFFKHLHLSPYRVSQSVDGIENRTAYGMESRWSQGNIDVFNLVNYETNYEVVDLVMLNALLRYKDTNVNLVVDDRRSPNLEIRNALNGGPLLHTFCDPSVDINNAISFESIDQALIYCSEQQISEFVDLNTGKFQVISLAFNHRLNTRHQVNFSVSKFVSEFRSLVPEQVDAGVTTFSEERENADQISLSGDWLVNKLYLSHDSASAGFRYTNDANYDSISVNLAYRLVFARSLRLNNRIQTEFRANQLTEDQIRFRPSVKLDYKLKRFQFQFEINYDDYRYIGGTLSDLKTYLITAGFRHDF